jgi:hypothetical protein
MGIGRTTTPDAFIKACNVFVYVENLVQTDEAKEQVEVKTPAVVKEANEVKTTTVVKASAVVKKPATIKAPAKAKPNASQKILLNLLRRAFDIAMQDDDGWVHLGALGNALQRIDPSFDSRTYGHKTLSLLVKSLPTQLEDKGAKKTGTSTIYVRMKNDG